MSGKIRCRCGYGAARSCYVKKANLKQCRDELHCKALEFIEEKKERTLTGILYVMPYCGDGFYLSKEVREVEVIKGVRLPKIIKEDVRVDTLLEGFEGKMIKVTVEEVKK